MQYLLTMKLSIQVVFTIISSLIGTYSAQGQFCPFLGPDQVLPCGVNSTTLTADLTNCGNPGNPVPRETDTYLVENIPFAPNPTTGTAITLSDDAVSGALPIGFTFCFFGNSYTQFYIGSNGWIGFSAGQPTTFTSATIPSTGGTIPKNCIMGPWQDWHPGISGGPYIRYQTIGTAPCRKLVVSYTNIPFFSCTTTLGTFQIVLNEGTNIIENHITIKPSCTAWAGGTAVQGIHNLAGTVAFTVPGRNSTVWTAFNESWRYVPNGAVVPPTLVWYEVGNPTPLATGVNSIVVTPAPGGTQYTAHLTYTGCYAGYNVCNPPLGGSGPDTVLVSPTIVPAPTMSSLAETCEGDLDGQATATPSSVPGPYDYIWTLGGNPVATNLGVPGPNTITGLAPGTYNVLVIDGAGCQAISSVVVNPGPNCCAMTIVSATPTSCSPADNSYSISGTITVVGAPSSGTLTISACSGNPVVLTAPFTSPISYTITGVNADNASCTVTANFSNSPSCIQTTTLQSPPSCDCVADAGPAQIITCTSPSVTLDGTGSVTTGLTYQWLDPSNNPIATTATTNVSAAGTYTLNIVNATGCTSTATVEVTQNITPPVASVGPAQTLTCTTTSVTLDGSASTGNSLSYTWTNSLGNNVGNTATISVTTPDTYTLTVTNGDNGCQASTTVVVIQDVTPPIANAGATQNLSCSVTSVLLDGSASTAGMNYEWTDGSGTNISSTITASVSSPGTYTLMVTNPVNGCSASSSVTITQSAVPPVASIGTAQTLTCTVTNVTLDASGSTGNNLSYAWTNPSGTNIGSGSTVSVSSPGTYTVTVTDGLNGCTATATVTVIQDITPPAATIIGGTTITCAATSVTLNANPVGAGFSYVWTLGATNVGTNQTINVSSGGTYTLQVTGSNGCTATTTQVVSYDTLPPNAQITGNLQLNCTNASTVLSAQPSGATYVWTFNGNPAGTSSTLTATQTGNYGVAITGANGCTGTTSAVVTQVFDLNASFTASPESGTYPLDVQFTNTSSSNATSFEWSFGNGNFSTLVNPSNVYADSGSYVVMLIASTPHCSDTAYITINVLGESLMMVPNVFTPNGDGVNDVFKVQAENIVKFEMIILNRWGSELFYSNDITLGWDGDNHADGTYYYIIRATGIDAKVYDLHGVVTKLSAR